MVDNVLATEAARPRSQNIINYYSAIVARTLFENKVRPNTIETCFNAQYVVVCRVLSVVIFEKETKDRRSRNRFDKSFFCEFWTLFCSLDQK